MLEGFWSNLGKSVKRFSREKRVALCLGNCVITTTARRYVRRNAAISLNTLTNMASVKTPVLVL
ncbi:hypothetical protein EB232_26565 [Mesorhizobium sp. NZP2077]|nr:hypothetical protein EB232_26565 [Mesorhizobium sp. NZP2077]